MDKDGVPDGWNLETNILKQKKLALGQLYQSNFDSSFKMHGKSFSGFPRKSISVLGDLRYFFSDPIKINSNRDYIVSLFLKKDKNRVVS